MPTAHAAGTKVLMIGIDAGDIDFIRSSLDTLPRLRKLLADGSPLELRSTAETLTSSVWPTFSSGTLPGEHGIYYPMQWDSAGMQLRRVTDDWIYYEPFWYELARRGVQVTVLDAPFSPPSRLERGVEVLNWGSQECLGPFESNRPGLAREIRRRFGRHPMGHDIPVQETPARLERIRGNLVAGARRKGELARWLMATTEWDLFLTVFSECHRGGHILWPEPDNPNTAVPENALADVYRAVDQAIGHVLDGVDPSSTTVIVFSVHGMGANFTQEHFLLQIMERINAGFEGEGASAAEPPPTQGGPMRMLRKALPGQLQHMIAKAVPAAVRDWVVKRAYHGGLDWSRTQGFALIGSGEGYLRFNLAGREAGGVIRAGSESHQRYRKWLRESILALEDAATGAPIVKDIVSPAELHPGPRADLLPDLIIRWQDLLPTPEICSDRLGRMTSRLATGRTGDHRPDGFAIVTGDERGVDRAPPLEHIADFAGFVRHLLIDGSRQ